MLLVGLKERNKNLELRHEGPTRLVQVLFFYNNLVQNFTHVVISQMYLAARVSNTKISILLSFSVRNTICLPQLLQPHRLTVQQDCNLTTRQASTEYIPVSVHLFRQKTDCVPHGGKEDRLCSSDGHKEELLCSSYDHKEE